MTVAPAMAIDSQQRALVFAAAAALRLLLFAALPALPALLAARVEVSTPVSSFKRCMPAARRPPTPMAPPC